MLKQSRALSGLAEFTRGRAACHPEILVAHDFGRDDVATCSGRQSATAAERLRAGMKKGPDAR